MSASLSRDLDIHGIHPPFNIQPMSLSSERRHPSPPHSALEAGSRVTGTGDCTLLRIPEEILLHIATYLDLFSLQQMAHTCKLLLPIFHDKVLWDQLLKNILSRRPVPMRDRNYGYNVVAPDLTAGDMRKAMFQAMRLDSVLAQEVVKPTRVVYSSGFLVDADEQDDLQWVWNMDLDELLVTYSHNLWFSCTIKSTGKVIAFQTTHHLSCWDFNLDTDGLTIVFNSTQQAEEGQRMQIYRVNFADSSWESIWDADRQGWVRSNFLEDDIAGCVMKSGVHTFLSLHVLNWRTRKYAIINTGIISPVNFSASSTNLHLLLCTERMGATESWTYEFSFLRELVERAESTEIPYDALVPPQFHHQTQYTTQKEIAERWDGRIVPTTRGTWDGGKSIFNIFHSENDARECITWSPVCDGTELSLENMMASTSIGESASEQDSTRHSKSVSRRAYVYQLPEGWTLSTGGGWYTLFTLGHSGKHAVWVEEQEGPDGEEETLVCRLASFDHNEVPTDGPPSSNVSTIVVDDGEFSWRRVSKIDLDDNAGVLTCATGREIWKLYF